MYGTFTDYGGFEHPMIDSEFTRELEAKLKACKTEEEKNEVVREYVSARLLSLLCSVAIVAVLAIVVGAVYYFFLK